MRDIVVVLAPVAEQDISDAFLWYRDRNALAAEGFRAEVFDAVDRIVASPLSRPFDNEGNGMLVLKRFPYSVIYEVVGATITILAVAHHRRRPNYWRAGKS